jgi:hypothetical protein
MLGEFTAKWQDEKDACKKQMSDLWAIVLDQSEKTARVEQLTQEMDEALGKFDSVAQSEFRSSKVPLLGPVVFKSLFDYFEHFIDKVKECRDFVDSKIAAHNSELEDLR